MIDKTDPTNRDTVPAMLTPGEFVLNKEASTMFAPVIEQMNAAGLQHRAMKNMGGGIQNYNDGGYSFMKPTSKFRGALKDLEADSYSTLFANSEKKETPWKGVDITGMSMAEVLALVKPNGAFHKYNKDNFDKNTTAVGKYQFVGSTLRDLKKRGVFEKLGIDDDTPFNESTQDALAAYLAVHRVKDRTKGTMSSAREELRNEWEGFKKLDDNQLDDIINEISGEVGVTLVGTTPQVPTQSVSVAPITSIPPQMRPKDLAPQMTTGTIDTMASSRPQMRPNTQADPISIEQAIMQTSVPQVQAAPPAPTDFGEAFKDARADMGAGGIFTFRGRDYTTNYAEEEDKTMTANMGGSVYLNMGGYPQGYLDNYLATMDPEYLNRIEQMSGIDAVREVQAQVRPDYTNPDNVEENFAASMDLGRLAKYPDHVVDKWYKSYYLSEPNTGMTTEKAMAKRKNLASNSYVPMPEVNSDDPVTNPSSGFGSSLEYNYDTYLKEMGYNDVPAVREMWRRYQDKMNAKSAEVPMPEVNSDESLLQGSSGSVASAARSFPSDYPINMDVPRVEGYNIPAPIPAPRPTMIGGQLYYLNGDGLVTDSNGNPVQDPEIGAAVQNKLNYSPEESAANAQAYNESMAEQAVFNGVAPQSVNPSYDSMRQQQESNAAEAERIRAEVAQTDMERQALNDEFNNREPVVVPPLETGPLFVEGFVPDVPAYEGELGGLMPPYEGELGGGGPSYVPPNPSNATFKDKSLEELYNMFAVNGGQGSRADPTLAQALTKEIEAREAAGESFNVYDTSLQNAAALYLGGRNSPEIQRQQIVADRSSRNAEKAAAALAAQQAELQAKLDAGTVTQRDIDSFERQRRATTQAQAVAARNEETAKLTAEQQAALIGPATDIESDNTEATKALREAESKRLQSYDPITGTYSNTNEPEKSTGDVFSEVEVKVDEVKKTAQPTTSIQENAARENANNVDLNKVDKGDQRVAGAMDTIKSVFGDLFDSKELVRAAIMYLGGRATGMDGQQALAFAGKTYLAREEAKGIRTQKFVDKLISDGKHTMGSIAAYKKSLDPNDLKLIGLTFSETGNTGTYYATNAAGNFVTLQLKEMKGSDDGVYLQDSNGKLYDPAKLHQDPKRVKGTPEFKTALASQISLYKDTFDELRLQDGIVTNKKDGKPAVYKTDLKPSVVAADTAAWALRYGVPLQIVPSLMTEAYKLAIGGKDINGNPTRAEKIEPYLNQLWITNSAGDPNNFKIGKSDKAKFVETSTVSSWVTNVHNQMKEVNPEFNAVTPIRFSTWLRQTDISGKWSLPEEQGGLSQEARNAFTKRGNAVGKSGYMQYILEEAAKNYEKSLNKPTT